MANIRVFLFLVLYLQAFCRKLKMNKQIKHIINVLSLYWGVIYFITLLLFTHFLWEWAVDGDLQSQQIAILGKDLTMQFHSLSTFTAQTVHRFVRLFPDTNDFLINDTYLKFAGGRFTLNIIWGCTAVKQLYIFIVIMAFYRGPWKKKLWYIPLGCVILWVYNIIRIASIAYLVSDHPERFDFLHEGLFRYIFYGLIFLLWMIWEEKFVKNLKTKSK